MPIYGAVDIGSNSVRMMVAETKPTGAPAVLASGRQVTRLGESVFREGRVSEAAMEQITTVLAGMRKAMEEHTPKAVRAVATSAIRDCRNQNEFLDRTSAALLVPVEVISGLEEARLIHMGVMSRWAQPGQRVLILDVGGGSAEIIFSEGGRDWQGYSKPLGAVRLTEAFLKSDPPTQVQMHRLEQYIREKLEPSLAANGGRRFDCFIGASSTAGALVCAVAGIARNKRHEADQQRVTAKQVRRLYQELRLKDVEARRKVTGIGPRRAEIILAGAAVFTQVLDAFELEALHYSEAGVRDGIIADLAARDAGQQNSCLEPEPLAVVEGMARKYGVSTAHAKHVAGFTHRLFEALQPLHNLDPEMARLLEASAYLHDIGHYISDTAHHKHSAYIVSNAAMPGFTAAERQFLALLCRFHRKSMPASRHPEFQALPTAQQRRLLLLLPLLRLADALDRSHRQSVQTVDCRVEPDGVVLEVRSGQEADLEIWAAERVGEIFTQVYGKTLVLASMGT